MSNAAEQASAIPVLGVEQLGGEPDEGVLAELRRGFGELGLVHLSGHRVDPEALGRLHERFLALTARPEAEKRRYGRPDIWYQRGWTPPNTERAVVAGGQPDFKECWFAMVGPRAPELAIQHPELFSENVWPDDDPEFRDLYLEIGRSLQETGEVLLEACALALGLPRGTFSEAIRGGAHVLRALRYLPVDAEALARGVLWGEEHTDFNLVTLLPGGRFLDPEGRPAPGPEDGSGLFLRTPATAEHPEGRLISGTPPSGCLVAQVGQELEILTGGRFLATPHVVTPPGEPGWSRTSLAHFVHVHPHRVLHPMEPFLGEETMRIYGPPVLTGTYATKTMVDIGLAPPEAMGRFGYRHYDRLAAIRDRARS